MDDGSTENVFGLSAEELKMRTVEHMDIADPKMLPAPGAKDYKAEEDPRVLHSKFTNKGPCVDVCDCACTVGMIGRRARGVMR
jgi:hypothetical protein